MQVSVEAEQYAYGKLSFSEILECFFSTWKNLRLDDPWDIKGIREKRWIRRALIPWRGGHIEFVLEGAVENFLFG